MGSDADRTFNSVIRARVMMRDQGPSRPEGQQETYKGQKSQPRPHRTITPRLYLLNLHPEFKTKQ